MRGAWGRRGRLAGRSNLLPTVCVCVCVYRLRNAAALKRCYSLYTCVLLNSSTHPLSAPPSDNEPGSRVSLETIRLPQRGKIRRGDIPFGLTANNSRL